MVEHVILFHLIWCMLQFSGRVPSLQEGNLMENIFIPPWKQHRPIVLGRPLSHTLPFYFYNTRMNRFILTYAYSHMLRSPMHSHSNMGFPWLLHGKDGWRINSFFSLQGRGSKMHSKTLFHILLWSPFLRYRVCHGKLINNGQALNSLWMPFDKWLSYECLVGLCSVSELPIISYFYLELLIEFTW